MSDGTAGRPGGAVDTRVPGGTVRAWIVLEAHRWSVAAAICGLLMVALLVPSLASPEAASALLAAGDPVETLFQALVAGIVTGVTLVVTITQLVLSQELGAAADQRERMRGALAFQEDLEGALDRGVSPPQPAAFLGWLVEGIRERAETLRDGVRGSEDALARWIDGFVDDVCEDAALAGERLEGAEFGTFQVVHAALDYNYSWKIHLCRRLRAEHGGALGEETRGALDRLLEALGFFGPAREHFKTLYFQWELTNLSREIVYVAVPALVVAIGTLLHVDAVLALPATVLGLGAGVWAVTAGAVISLLPFVLLLSYMLRIATVTQRTLAMGPFVLRRTDRDRELVRGLDAVG